jgi:hypothetical protein
MSEARAHDNCCHYTHEFGTSCVLPDPLVLIEDFRRADRPEARVAVEGLTVEMLAKAICEAAHPAPSSEPPWSPCPSHEVLARKAFANLPAPRPSEPDRTAALVEERHAALGHPPQGSRIACGCVAAVSAALRRADRPEARVATAADGICDCGAAHRWDVDRQEFVPTHTTAPRPPEPDRTAALVTEFRALVDEARANHVRWEHEAEVLEECIRPLCLGARVLLWPDIEDPRTSALSTPRPPEPLDDLAMQEALLEARTERDRLTAENERLRADLATFTEEPGVLARVGAEHTTYWYNQTRLLDAKLEAMTDRTAALVERLAARQCEASAWYDLPDDGVSRCMDPEYNEEEPAICAPCEARAALAATPEPAPVADGVEPVCGHKRYRGDLPCGATASDDWHKRSTWEQDPELYHPFTPPTAPDGAP